MVYLRQMWKGLWPVLLFMLFFAVLLIVAEAPTPDAWHVDPQPATPEELSAARDGAMTRQTGWEDVTIFTLAFMFLGAKATVMLRRMGRPVDWLTITLVAANGAFMSLYLLILSNIFFPHWFLTHPDAGDWILRLLRWGLILTLAWGTLAVILTPDDEGYHVIRKEARQWTGELQGTRRSRRLAPRFRRTLKSKSAARRERSMKRLDRIPVW